MRRIITSGRQEITGQAGSTSAIPPFTFQVPQGHTLKCFLPSSGTGVAHSQMGKLRKVHLASSKRASSHNFNPLFRGHWVHSILNGQLSARAWARETSRQSRACVALAGNWVQLPAYTQWLTITFTSSSRDLMPSPDLQGPQAAHTVLKHTEKHTVNRGKKGKEKTGSSHKLGWE